MKTTEIRKLRNGDMTLKAIGELAGITESAVSYRLRPDVKKAYQQTKKHREYKKAYRKSERGKAVRNAYQKKFYRRKKNNHSSTGAMSGIPITTSVSG